MENTQYATVNPYDTGLDVTGHSLDDLWPVVDPQFRPFGAKVLVQLRRVMLVSKGGIALVDSTGDAEAWNMQVGKIIAMGPLAFKNRKTFEDWPEGAWAKQGDYVRFPRWGGDRLSIDLKDGNKPVVILILNDSDLWGAYEGDPRQIRAFIE